MARVTTSKLHELIQSLKKEEKRYFKIQAKKYTRKNDVFYLKIFDYLDKIEVVDRDEFNKKFKAVKGVSALQTYLYKQILKSLRAQHNSKNIDIQLSEGVADLEILYKKELLEATQEKLQELIALAELHDKIFYIPMLYEWWFRLENTRLKYLKVKLPDFEHYIQKYNNSIKALEQYKLYRIQLGRILYTIKDQNSRQTIDLIQEVRDILPVYQPDQEKFSTAIAGLQLRMYLASVARDSKASYYYNKELYALLKKQPKEVFEMHEKIYYAVLMALTDDAPSIDLATPFLEEIEDMFFVEQNLQINHKTVSYLTVKIEIYILKGELAACGAFIEQWFDIENLVKNSSFSFLYYRITLYYYASKNYTLALTIIDDLLLDKENGIRIRNLSLLLKMIIYYEQEEYILLSYFIDSFRRQLRRNKALLNFEQQLISLMNDLVKLPKEEHLPLMTNFRTRIAKDLTVLSTHEREVLLYFNYVGWLDSKIHNKPFEKIYFWDSDNIEF